MRMSATTITVTVLWGLLAAVGGYATWVINPILWLGWLIVIVVASIPLGQGLAEYDWNRRNQ